MATYKQFIVTIVAFLALSSQALAQVRISDEAVRERAEQIRQEKAEKKADEARKKSYSKEEREALKQLESDAKKGISKNKEVSNLNELASVLGCDNSTQVLTNQVEQRSRFRTRAHITVVNASDIPFNIRTESRYLGHVVKDVCVGGSLGLHFTSSFWSNWNRLSPIQFRGTRGNRTTTEEIVLVAIGHVIDEDGHLIRTIEKRHVIRLNTSTGRISGTTIFNIKGMFLPRKRAVREPRVRTRDRKETEAPIQAEPVAPAPEAEPSPAPEPPISPDARFARK